MTRASKFYPAARRLFCCVVFCFIFRNPLSRAADVIETPDYFIQSLGIRDGLPHELVHHIIQDQTGYLWISTSAGLVRFDGNEFQTVTSPLLNNQESDLLYAVCTGANGGLWSAPNCGGLVEYNEKTRTFLQIAPVSDLPPHPPTFLTQTPDGAFWIGYFQSELRRWKDGKTMLFTNDLALGQTISLATDRSNQVWVASDTLVAKYENGQLIRLPDFAGTKARLGAGRAGDIWVATTRNLQKIVDGQISLIATNPPWSSGAGIPTSVFEDDHGILWIGTRAQGLYRFSDGNFNHVPTSHPWITDLNEDNEGNVWVATHGGGIDRIRRKIFSTINNKLGSREDVYGSVCEDRRGNFWLADTANNEVVELPKGHHRRTFQSPLLRDLRVVCVDSKNQLWMATRTSILKWLISTNFTPETVVSDRNISPHTLFSASNGDVWAGGDDGFLGRCHDGRWEEFSEIKKAYGGVVMRSLAEDTQSNIWISLNSGDLLCYGDGKFAHFDTGNGLPGSTIHCILADPDGSLWMTTTRDGLVLWHDGTFNRVAVEQGFPGGIIDQMVEDDFGRIWFATEAGFYHVDRAELLDCALGKIPRVHPIAFGRDVGLVGYSPVSSFQPASWKAKSGQLLFTTHKGVVAIDPVSWKPNTNPPPVLVDEVLVNDEKISARGSIELPPNAKKFEFRLSVIEFSAPEQVKVRHWLEGFDSGWVDEGGRRSFAYPKLPPGQYTLRFGACNPDGVWNDSIVPFVITVVPAWWQMHSVQAASAIGAVLLLVYAVRTWSHRRLRSKLEKLEQKQVMEKERARIAKDLHDDLGGTLTEIGLLAGLASRNGQSPEKLKSAAEFFSERVRGLARTLDTVVWTVNPRNDSLDELATYLCGFSQELFGMSPIRFRLDVTGEIPPVPLTPEERSNLFLTAKEAFNNIIKHSGATEAWLRIRMEGDRFCVSIEDNGRGFQPDQAETVRRNGLANMRSRMAEAKGTFSLTSAPGRGTTVAISLCLASGGRMREISGRENRSTKP